MPVTTPPDLNGVLAANLRQLRKKLGLSQEAFAERCGLHRTYIGAIERGERNVTLKTLGQIAETLGVAPLDLLKRRSAGRS
jgi:transcriptional regulator with XRE-family HTH domain